MTTKEYPAVNNQLINYSFIFMKQVLEFWFHFFATACRLVVNITTTAKDDIEKSRLPKHG